MDSHNRILKTFSPVWNTEKKNIMSKYSDMTVGSVDRCPVKY